ncbi:hypothetical protein ABZX62_00155 [Streptomyces flavidovirens]|uniref:hypothetical protein n=1 Tax=Streptomyces flavidovirens TaxID=67298 RepID=UPI0033B2AE9D
MTENELLMLMLGTNLGVSLMLIVHFLGQYVDARRDLRAAEAVLARQAKRKATEDWRDALAVRERT